MKSKKVKASELHLGDIVKASDVAYGVSTVKNISQDASGVVVTLFRPYVVTADFSYTGGVICYIGVEEYNITGSMEVDLLERGPELK